MAKLFLASEAKGEILNKLEDFIGKKLEQLNICYIPTAANGEREIGDWKNSSFIALSKERNLNITIIELEESKFRDLENDFSGFDMILVAGGVTGYLLYWMRRSGFDVLISKLLDKGVVYVGSSAGSMVCSKTQYLAEVMVGEEEKGASIFPGLGFIDFEIYPHYKDELLEKIENVWKKGQLYLLKDGEAITIDNGIINVLGEKRVITK